MADGGDRGPRRGYHPNFPQSSFGKRVRANFSNGGVPPESTTLALASARRVLFSPGGKTLNLPKLFGFFQGLFFPTVQYLLPVNTMSTRQFPGCVQTNGKTHAAPNSLRLKTILSWQRQVKKCAYANGGASGDESVGGDHGPPGRAPDRFWGA